MVESLLFSCLVMWYALRECWCRFATYLIELCAGESIPVRLFLTPYELTPTYRNINNKFSVKYYLNLVLVDEEDRRYFKQQEITIYRLLDTPQAS